MPAPGLGIPLPPLTAKGSPPSSAPCPELPWDSACGLPGCTLFLPSPRVPASLPQVRTPDTGPQSQVGPAGEAGGLPGQTGPLPPGGQRGRPWPHSLVSSLGHILSLGSRIIASSCPARARGPWDWVGVRHRWQRTRAGKHLDHSLWGQEPCPPGQGLLLRRDFPNRSDNPERGAGQEAGLGFQGGGFQGPPLLCREFEGPPPPCKVKSNEARAALQLLQGLISHCFPGAPPR